MLTKQQKIKLVAELGDVLERSQSLIFVDFAGLSTAETTALKRELKREKIGFRVIKKSLLGFAFEKSKKPSFDFSGHKGSLAVVSGSAEPTVMSKILNTFAIKSKKLKILGGFLIGEKMMAEGVIRLAQLPPREVMLAQVLQLMLSPVSGFARVLDGISKKVA